MNIRKLFARAAMTLVLMLLTTTTAWATTETLTYTFYRDGNYKSYLVYGGTNYQLSNDEWWSTGTATAGGVTVTITSGTKLKVATWSETPNYRLLSQKTYSVQTTFAFQHSSKYITNVKIYRTAVDPIELNNNTKSCSVSLDYLQQPYQIDVTLSDTKPVTNYNITYVLNGGTNAAGNPATYADNAGVASFAAPTRTGYDFGGWYDNASFTGSAVTSISAGTTGDKTLYAK